jgi:hypothetical protein
MPIVYIQYFAAVHCLIEKNTVITKPICSLWILKQKKAINAGGWDLAEMWNEEIYYSLTANAKVATGFDPIILSRRAVWGAADEVVLNKVL